MNARSDRFWCKVLFKNFIGHYRRLTDEQIIADVRSSMDDLEDLNDDGQSFGSKMVRWSMERLSSPAAEANRINGAKGGRPKKNIGDAPTREDVENCNNWGSTTASAHLESRPSPTNRDGVASLATTQQGTTTNDSYCATPSRKSKSQPMPLDKHAVLDFAAREGLDINDAYECWYATINERKGMTADGKPINNWKAYTRKWCETRRNGRNDGN